MVLFEPFLPTMAQVEFGAELTESVEGARDVAGLLGTKGEMLACIAEAVRVGSAAAGEESDGVGFAGAAGRLSLLKT